MPHIHTLPGQHDLTVSAYVFNLSGSEPKLLLHMHKLLGKYLQIGGHVELDETPWQAIAHELREEAGYNLNQLKLLQPKERIKSLKGTILHPVPLALNTHNFNSTHFHTDIVYVFVTKEEPAEKVDKGESRKIGWFTREQVNKMGNE